MPGSDPRSHRLRSTLSRRTTSISRWLLMPECPACCHNAVDRPGNYTGFGAHYSSPLAYENRNERRLFMQRRVYIHVHQPDTERYMRPVNTPTLKNSLSLDDGLVALHSPRIPCLDAQEASALKANSPQWWCDDDDPVSGWQFVPLVEPSLPIDLQIVHKRVIRYTCDEIVIFRSSCFAFMWSTEP